MTIGLKEEEGEEEREEERKEVEGKEEKECEVRRNIV